jgi:hypothetical protein
VVLRITGLCVAGLWLPLKKEIHDSEQKKKKRTVEKQLISSAL